MKLKEFSTKYNIEYHIAYRAMTESGDIKTHTHDEEYPEDMIYSSVMAYFSKREQNFDRRRLAYTNERKKLKSKYFGKETEE